MGLFDSLKGAVEGIAGQAEGSVLQNALGGNAGLSDMLTRLQNGGLGEQVSSWLGSGANLPVSAEQIESVVGDGRIQSVASALGIDPAVVSKFVADHLPQLVDHLSPNGTLPQTS